MELKYDDLKAFISIQKYQSFTKAGEELGLSQPAITQKVSRLETTLQTALIIRQKKRVLLTDDGQKLLIFAKEAVEHQKNFLNSFDQYDNELKGNIRIATFSSVMRSIVIPTLSSFMQEHSKASLELQSYEMNELENVLRTNQADFIITDYFPRLLKTEQHEIGQEEYVIIKSRKIKNIPNVFLDHTPADNATESYFKFLEKKQDYQRKFLGDVYSLIDGVALGLGKAVMSKHLIVDDKRFIIEKQKKRYFRPIVLSYYQQSYYSPIQQKIIEIFKSL